MVNTFIRLLRKSSLNSPLQQGQVLLIVVLVMVVALTVGLSVATRSITNLRTTTEEENSQRAFSAAEAGIERAIQSQGNLTSTQGFGNNATIKNVSYNQLTANNDVFTLSDNKPITQNLGADVWFAKRDTNGALDLTDAGVWPSSGTSDVTFYWGNSGETCPDAAALEIVFISNTSSNGPIITTHQLADPCPGRGNNASSGNFGGAIANNVTVNGTPYGHSIVFSGVSRLIQVRVVPLYKTAKIAVKATDLPSQGQKITSTGESGETFRKIEVTRPYPGIPVELFSVLFSPAGN